ncbi:MAG: GNAT family N-acetyltransferase [Burkholderiaceae bacterium]|nr:GNAT family N-acetyltransferase [Burkholderiaceae bacterium]
MVDRPHRNAHRELSFRSLQQADMPLLQGWLARPHVSQWWGPAPTLAEVEAHYLPLTEAGADTLGYIALLDDQAIGFIQSYIVLGSGGGWWERETDPGARGIDQFLAYAEQLNQGLGSRMIRCFVDGLFLDPAVSKVQTDPSPGNARAIRCYVRAGFAPQGEVITPDGPALLMIRHRPVSASQSTGVSI